MLRQETPPDSLLLSLGFTRLDIQDYSLVNFLHSKCPTVFHHFGILQRRQLNALDSERPLDLLDPLEYWKHELGIHVVIRASLFDTSERVLDLVWESDAMPELEQERMNSALQLLGKSEYQSNENQKEREYSNLDEEMKPILELIQKLFHYSNRVHVHGIAQERFDQLLSYSPIPLQPSNPLVICIQYSFTDPFPFASLDTFSLAPNLYWDRLRCHHDAQRVYHCNKIKYSIPYIRSCQMHSLCVRDRSVSIQKEANNTNENTCFDDSSILNKLYENQFPSAHDTANDLYHPPVAWVLCHSDMALGCLFVQPEYRKQGLAQKVLHGMMGLLEQWQTQLKNPLPKVAYAEVWNTASHACLQRAGFKPTARILWSTLQLE